jgi:hypothetical protein
VKYAFGRSLESGGRFCVGAFCRNLVSVTLEMFSHFTYFIKKVYKCTFGPICKNNTAMNCTTVQHTQRSFIPVNSDGSCARLVSS